MATEPIITNERVDDIPVLLTQIERMGVKKLIDKHSPTHGNWQGESLGSVVVIWLAHILSQADHRLNHVQGWACKRLETLKTLIGESLHELDLTDDRLEAALRYLDCDRNWNSFEDELGSSLLQVYDITPERVRLDSTTASSYCRVNPEGLFQWGHSKDYRPDLAQVKIMLSTLDPLGMPIATEILSGEKADDPLYIPAIERVRPTAELLLAAFKEITLLLIEVKNEVYAHLTALSPLQQRILVLLGFSTTIYTQLGGQSFTPE